MINETEKQVCYVLVQYKAMGASDRQLIDSAVLLRENQGKLWDELTVLGYKGNVFPIKAFKKEPMGKLYNFRKV